MDRTPRVVVGVCGTLGGLAALYRGVREAEQRGAVLVPVTAWEPTRQDGLRPLSELEHAARRRMDTAFEQTFAGYPPDLRIHPLIVRGDAGRALVSTADRPDDLLVVGSGSHRRMRHLLTGSVARHCKTHARCPVVVVTPSQLLESLSLLALNGAPLSLPAGDLSSFRSHGTALADHSG